MKNEQLLTGPQAAKVLDVDERTLANWRDTKTGPPATILKTGYRLPDLREYLASLAGVVIDLPMAITRLDIFRSENHGSGTRTYTFEESAEILGLAPERLQVFIDRGREPSPGIERNYSARVAEELRRIEAATQGPKQTAIEVGYSAGALETFLIEKYGDKADQALERLRSLKPKGVADAA